MEMIACGTNNTPSSTIKTIRISRIVEIYVTVEEISILVAYVMYKQKLQYRQELCYKSTINGCSLEIGGKEKFFEDQNFMELFFSHLIIILSLTNLISYLSFFYD
ncbi:uncharacterized protein CELE_Y6G8.6 [Caenorhabditis elegans]|uniref:Transmembrane protein n=1 Tax=Caenorhabditis elegans TaxID=6239 RepID=Q564R0_CAEEL|nr:Transmembrane protein [Caenorhabditis elegans]CAI79257.1 Transmembrane protein [Caenorhabditis elegans]|eukprot:NP_001024285.1 Uncharacterized protein CELE_Y6G8.6 [Caenorhabditis elegans]